MTFTKEYLKSLESELFEFFQIYDEDGKNFNINITPKKIDISED